MDARARTCTEKKTQATRMSSSAGPTEKRSSCGPEQSRSRGQGEGQGGVGHACSFLAGPHVLEDGEQGE